MRVNIFSESNRINNPMHMGSIEINNVSECPRKDDYISFYNHHNKGESGRMVLSVIRRYQPAGTMVELELIVNY